MTLLRPEWLIAWLPLLSFLLWRSGTGLTPWQRWIDADLLRALTVQSRGPWQRTQRILPWLSLFVLVFALAGPASRSTLPVYSLERPVVFVLDQSLSMASDDISPSRHVRAQQKIQDWLSEHPERPAGLVAYSGTAHMVSPITTDHKALNNFLLQLDPFIMPVLGSHAVAAMNIATELLGDNAGDILWFTDDLTAAQRARLPDIARQQRLGIIVVGTREGAPVLLPDGSPLRLDNGQLLIPPVDTQEIARLAQASNVRWQPVSVDNHDLNQVLPPVLSNAAYAAGERVQYRDYGPYLLLLALPGLLLWWRRGALYGLTALSIGALWSPPVEASGLRDLFLSQDQRAAELLPTNPEQAMDLFLSPEWQGYAALQANQYERALAILEPLDDPLATYNLGHALVNQGLFEEAMAAFETASQQAPDFAEAEHNRALLERFLAQPPPQQESSGDDEPSDGPSEPGDDPSDAGAGSDDDGSDLAEGATELSSSEAPEVPPQDDAASQQERAQQDFDSGLDEDIRGRLPPADNLFLQRKFRFEYESDPSMYDREGPLW
ncbi:VWA domain-containing protein [Salinispirillum sp. LH 10-3-1]|uniref:VWA domain-containing protein n=1 Tax=Salinispirillum sp. LH 10-3-1 TaxID=2952525 RepID=A0AB38YKX3_9GAMM